jgi:glycosyltransferase involved in cell wall biosynthesis
MLAEARRRCGAALRLHREDAFSTSFEDGAYRAIVSLRFAFHHRELAPVVGELGRIVAPGGVLVMDTLRWSPRALAGGLQRRLGGRVFTHRPADVRAALERARFEIEACSALEARMESAQEIGVGDAATERRERLSSVIATSVLAIAYIISAGHRYLVNDDYQLLYTAWMKSCGNVPGRDFFVASYHLLTEPLVLAFRWLPHDFSPVFAGRAIVLLVLIGTGITLHALSARLFDAASARLAPLFALGTLTLLDRGIDLRPDVITALLCGAWSRLGRGLPCGHLATTTSLAEWLRFRKFRRVSCIPNFASLPPEQGEVELGDGRWVAYIGHSHPVKGIDDLLDAFDVAAAVRSDLRLLIALSSDGDASRVEARLSRSPVRDRIRRVGLVPVASVLRQVDALVLPFRNATTTTMYPSLLLEADLARCPVLVSLLPELLPILRFDSPDLMTFPPRRVDALARALAGVRPRAARAEAVLRLPPEEARLDALLAAYDERNGHESDASPHPVADGSTSRYPRGAELQRSRK